MKKFILISLFIAQCGLMGSIKAADHDDSWQLAVEKKYPKKKYPTGIESNIYIRLSGNIPKKISAIPAGLSLPRLERLDLRFNEIAALPENLNLPQLKHLELAVNKIAAIPANLSFPQLKYLDLSHNQIVELAANLNLPHLERLGISNNQITEIPATLNLKQLKRLELDRNQIAAIPDNLHLPRLEALSLVGNHIEYINPQILQQFPSLAYLYLNKNPLTQENIQELINAADREIEIVADDIGDQYLPAGHYIKGSE